MVKDGMVYDTYVSWGKEDNEADKERMERKCRELVADGWVITSVEYGEVAQAGSAVPGAANFGKTEPGWTIEVQRPDPKSKPREEPSFKVPKHARRRQDLENLSRWLREEWD